MITFAECVDTIKFIEQQIEKWRTRERFWFGGNKMKPRCSLAYTAWRTKPRLAAGKEGVGRWEVGKGSQWDGYIQRLFTQQLIFY